MERQTIAFLMPRSVILGATCPVYHRTYKGSFLASSIFSASYQAIWHLFLPLYGTIT